MYRVEVTPDAIVGTKTTRELLHDLPHIVAALGWGKNENVQHKRQAPDPVKPKALPSVTNNRNRTPVVTHS